MTHVCASLVGKVLILCCNHQSAVHYIAWPVLFADFRLIRLTSPNLNYLTAVGAIVLYIEVYLTVVQTESQDTVSVLCNVSRSLVP